MDHNDRVLSMLSKNFVNRDLYKIQLQNSPFEKDQLSDLQKTFKDKLKLEGDELDYFVFTGAIANNAYNPKFERINIILRNGNVVDVTEAADQLNISALSEPVEKHFLCHPKK